MSLENWPLIQGRYVVGNKESSVAVCTNASVEGIELDKEKVAIWGKCVTENIGIEKIIQNIVSNPYIRFLIICGKVSKGHFVGQALISLKNNGIDKDKRIIGAKGNTPYLKGISQELIERFRQQIIIKDLMGETDSKKIMEKVEDCLKTNMGMFKGEKIEIKEIKEIEAKPCSDWLPDPKGFFVISISPTRNKILVEHYQDDKLKHKIVGDSAEDIYKTIVYLDLIGDFPQTKEHSMYLAKELQKAETALKNNLDYEQEKDLVFKEEKKNDDYNWFD